MVQLGPLCLSTAACLACKEVSSLEFEQLDLSDKIPVV